METQTEEGKGAKEIVMALEEIKEEIKEMKREICKGLKELGRELKDGKNKGDVGKEKAEHDEKRGAGEAEGMTPSPGASDAEKVKEKEKKKGDKSKGETEENRRSWAEEVEDREEEEGRAAGKQREIGREKKDGQTNIGQWTEEDKENGDAEGEAKEEEKEKIWRQELAERKRRRTIVIIRALDREKGRRREGMEKWLKETTEREMEVEQVRDIECRAGGKDRMTQVTLKEEKDRQKLLEMSGKIWRLAKVAVGKDLTFLERRRDWMVRSKAEEARRSGKEVEMGDSWIKSEEETLWWNEREEKWAKRRIEEEGSKMAQGKEKGEMEELRQD